MAKTLEQLQAERTTLQQEAFKIRLQVREAEKFFASTDYYVNKVVRGEWEETNVKFVAYKKEARTRAVELEEAREALEKIQTKRKELIKEIQALRVK
jgi:chromosome segregation ATPase